jgi:hypothetical protein
MWGGDQINIWDDETCASEDEAKVVVAMGAVKHTPAAGHLPLLFVDGGGIAEADSLNGEVPQRAGLAAGGSDQLLQHRHLSKTATY